MVLFPVLDLHYCLGGSKRLANLRQPYRDYFGGLPDRIIYYIIAVAWFSTPHTKSASPVSLGTSDFRCCGTSRRRDSFLALPILGLERRMGIDYRLLPRRTGNWHHPALANQVKPIKRITLLRNYGANSAISINDVYISLEPHSAKNARRPDQ